MSSLIRKARNRDDAVVLTGGESGEARVVAAGAAVTAARSEAEIILAAAREQAEALMVGACEEAAALHVRAYEEGFQQGHAESAAALEARFSALIEVLQIAAGDARGLRMQVLRNTERDAIELVLDIVGKILGERAVADPSYAVDLAERALARAGNQNIVRIRVHPERKEIVAAAFVERHDAAGTPIEIAGDQRLDLGGCVVDLRAGVVDASTDAQLDEVRSTLHSLLESDE